MVFAVVPGLTTIFTMFSLALRPTHFLFGFHYNEMGTFLEYVILIYTVPFSLSYTDRTPEIETVKMKAHGRSIQNEDTAVLEWPSESTGKMGLILL